MAENTAYIVKDHLHYGGIVTFNRFEHSQNANAADIAIMGVPFDSGVTNRPGARFGPRAIREQSMLACCFHYPWDYAIGEKAKIIDYGDTGYYIGPRSTSVMIQETYEAAKEIFNADCKLLTLGGDHTIPFGPIRAASEKFGKLALLHFDSHEDNTPSVDGNFTHANFAYDLQMEGCLDPVHSAQVFIRTDTNKCGYNIFYAKDALDMSAKELSDIIKDIIGDMPVYLTFDIDAIDPAYAPGTGTPVIGGPSSIHVRNVLYYLQGLNVVAADVVEIAPAYDQSDITALAGATIAQDLLYLINGK